MTARKVTTLDELWMGEMRSVDVDGRCVLLIHLEEGIVAFEDRCSHQSVKLSRGRLEGNVVVCAAHEWRYDARTGIGINPRGERLRRYAVVVDGDDVLVDVTGDGT